MTKKITDMSMEEIDALSDDEFVAAARGGGVVPTTREREADLAAAPSDLAMVNKMRELRGQEPLGEQERASLSVRLDRVSEVPEEFFDAYYIAHDSQLGYYRQEHRRGHAIPPEYEAALRQRGLI